MEFFGSQLTKSSLWYQQLPNNHKVVQFDMYPLITYLGLQGFTSTNLISPLALLGTNVDTDTYALIHQLTTQAIEETVHIFCKNNDLTSSAMIDTLNKEIGICASSQHLFVRETQMKISLQYLHTTLDVLHRKFCIELPTMFDSILSKKNLTGTTFQSMFEMSDEVLSGVHILSQNETITDQMFDSDRNQTYGEYYKLQRSSFYLDMTQVCKFLQSSLNEKMDETKQEYLSMLSAQFVPMKKHDAKSFVMSIPYVRSLLFLDTISYPQYIPFINPELQPGGKFFSKFIPHQVAANITDLTSKCIDVITQRDSMLGIDEQLRMVILDNPHGRVVQYVYQK